MDGHHGPVAWTQAISTAMRPSATGLEARTVTLQSLARPAPADGGRYVTTDAVRPVLEAEGVPPERIGNLTNVFVSACRSEDDVRALIARTKNAIPELFVRPAPMPAAESGILAAADRFLSAAPSPEIRGALQRRAERRAAEAALLARLSRLMKEAS